MDTGCLHSLLPTTQSGHCNATEELTALNGSKVNVYGHEHLTVTLNLGREFTWEFKIADTIIPIIGIDFLQHFGLLVDTVLGELVFQSTADVDTKLPVQPSFPVKSANPVLEEFPDFLPSYTFFNSRIDLVDKANTDTKLVSPKSFVGPLPGIKPFSSDPVASVAGNLSGAHNSLEIDNTPEGDSARSKPQIIERLEAEFPSVFDLGTYLRPVKHNTLHFIETEGAPVRSRVRRLSPEMRDNLKRELDHLLDLDIIEPSNSPFGSAVHLVPKSGGSYRITGDYRLLNRQTTEDSYPIPFLANFTSSLHGSTVFSNLDLYKSYYQVPVAPKHRHKTALVTPLGSYHFKRMPMGLTNSGKTLQRLMDEIFRDLHFVFVYVDDILIYSSSIEEHQEHLRAVFRRLHDYGLVVNKDKCLFGQEQLRFLGHRISSEGFSPLPEKVEAIVSFPKPSDLASLKRYLGMLNFYRRFLPHCAELLKPLNSLLAGKVKRTRLIQWSPEAEEAFERSKCAIADSARLAYPVRGALTSICTDASNVAVGAVLQQLVDGIERPLAFFSRALSDTERRYSTFDRELLSVYLAVRHFRHFLEGRQFTIFTDHKPLVAAFQNPMTNATPRQLRHVAYVSQFTSDLRYLKGTDNVVADCLSRIEPTVAGLLNPISPSLDYQKLAADQANDPSLNELLQSNHSLDIAEQDVHGSGSKLLGDISTGQFRPLVPSTFRRQIFDLFHGLSHPGIKGSQRLISDRFVWPCMKVEIRDWCKTCTNCQTSKIQRHVSAPLQHFQPPNRRFMHVHVDIVGPLPSIEGYSYLFTIIDRFTRWPEVIPIPNILAKTCASAFLLNWVARFGAPTIITSDRGSQFTSYLWSEMARFLGSKIQHTTAYHPASNGMNERLNKSLKVALKTQENPEDWYYNLPSVLLGLRAMVKEDIGCSAAELTLGSSLRLPGEFLEQTDFLTTSESAYAHDLVTFLSSIKPVLPRHPSHRKTYMDKELNRTTHVFVRRDRVLPPLSRPYEGPYKVLERHPKYFVLDRDGRDDSVSIDRLKPAFLLGAFFRDDDADQQLEPDLPSLFEPDHSPGEPTPRPPDSIDNTDAGIVHTRSGRSVNPPCRYLDYALY